MNDVLISIRPEWCEKIITGKKTVELRKTRPRLETPFKCYIYCTYGNTLYRSRADSQIRLYRKNADNAFSHHAVFNGRVIGEFVCDNIIRSKYEYDDDDPHYNPGPRAIYWPYIDLDAACLSHAAVQDYGGKKPLYSWHISDLKIYAEPIPVTAFRRPCINDLYCESCAMFNQHTEHCGNAALQITRPPQSWCYVEELKSA